MFPTILFTSSARVLLAWLRSVAGEPSRVLGAGDGAGEPSGLLGGEGSARLLGAGDGAGRPTK